MRLTTIITCLAACCLAGGFTAEAAASPAQRPPHVYHRPPAHAAHVRRTHRVHLQAHGPHRISPPVRGPHLFYPHAHRHRPYAKRHGHPSHTRLAPPPPLPALRATLIPAAPAAPHRDVTSTWQPYSYP